MIFMYLIGAFTAFLIIFACYLMHRVSIYKPKTIKVLFKQLTNKNILCPRYMTPGAAGIDLVSTSMTEKTINGVKCFTYNLGIAVEIPKGYYGLIGARSNICKTGCTLANGVGFIDSDYRGEIKAIFYGKQPPYKVGERCCQIIIMPYSETTFIETEKLSETKRDSGGFGSTGR